MQEVLPQINDRTKTTALSKLNLKISWRFLLTMFALTLCTGEIHEQIHIQTGRIICGGYGERDFNAWQTAADCAAPAWNFLATLAGPLWSYLVMWTGAFLLTNAQSTGTRAIGFSLIFAPLPFARIFTAITGGGDEKVVLHNFLQNNLNTGAIKILAAIVVTAVCLPSILIALRNIKNRFAILYVAGFSVLPLIILGFYIFKFLNGLLAAGFLASANVLGTPLLILFHFSLMTILFVFCRKGLLEITPDSDLEITNP